MGVVAHVDEAHVGAVEGLVVAGVDAEPLAADELVGGEALGDLGVVDDARGSCRARTRRPCSLASGSMRRSLNAPRKGRPPCCPARLEAACGAPRGGLEGGLGRRGRARADALDISGWPRGTRRSRP